MSQLIHISRIQEIATRKDGKGQLIPFNIVFGKLSTGEIVSGECVCTSYFFKNKTMNIKFVQSGQIRTIRTITILEFNGAETYI